MADRFARPQAIRTLLERDAYHRYRRAGRRPRLEFIASPGRSLKQEPARFLAHVILVDAAGIVLMDPPRTRRVLMRASRGVVVATAADRSGRGESWRAWNSSPCSALAWPTALLLAALIVNTCSASHLAEARATSDGPAAMRASAAMTYGGSIPRDDIPSGPAAAVCGLDASTGLLAVLLCASGLLFAFLVRRAAVLKARQVRFEASVRGHERALRTLVPCNRAIFHSSDERSLLDAVCRILVESGGYRMVWVGFAEHDERKTIRPVALAGDDGGYLSRVESVWADGAEGCGPVSAAIRRAEPVIARDSSSASAPWQAEAQKAGYAGCVGLPLAPPDATSGAWGALGICSAERECFGDDEVSLLAEVAHNLACGILSLRACREHQRITSQFTQADRIAVLSSFAASVASDVGSALAYPAATLALLTRRATSLSGQLAPEHRKEMQDLLAEARDGCEHVQHIVHDLEAFSQRIVPLPRRLDVREVLDWSIRIASSEARRRARLVKEYRPTPLVEAGQPQLLQVFWNLIANAVQAIPEGAPDTNEIRIATFTDGDGRAVIEVTDTGVGIPAEHIGRVFEPFFTAKPLGLGAGLGLSISRDLVAEMGGAIAVRSELGKGTTFRVALPAARVSAPVPERAQERSGRRARILVLADEPFLAHAIQRLLLPEHDVATEVTREAALKRIASGARFDVILCDLAMAGGGIEFHAEVARRDAALADRIVFLTAGRVSPEEEAFVARMRDRILEKPFNGETLRALMRGLVS